MKKPIKPGIVVFREGTEPRRRRASYADLLAIAKAVVRVEDGAERYREERRQALYRYAKKTLAKMAEEGTE